MSRQGLSSLDRAGCEMCVGGLCCFTQERQRFRLDNVADRLRRHSSCPVKIRRRWQHSGRAGAPLMGPAGDVDLAPLLVAVSRTLA